MSNWGWYWEAFAEEMVQSKELKMQKEAVNV